MNSSLTHSPTQTGESYRSAPYRTTTILHHVVPTGYRTNIMTYRINNGTTILLHHAVRGHIRYDDVACRCRYQHCQYYFITLVAGISVRGKTKHFILAGAHVCEATIFFGDYAIMGKALPSRTRGLARIMCEGARTLGGAWGGRQPSCVCDSNC